MTAAPIATPGPVDLQRVARTRPPAKLNLFLELLARRHDGFHEIDTVMVPIDWCDQLALRRSDQPGIRLTVDRTPAGAILARRLGCARESDPHSLLAIPSDHSNLVYRALDRFTACFEIKTGYDCQLIKSIPAGAGMGGASSNAAAALRCAAALSAIPQTDPQLHRIASEIGSDVPFFLGLGEHPIAAARARGRGERLDPIAAAAPLPVVVVFPSVSLSTAQVYAASQVPATACVADPMIVNLRSGNRIDLHREMMNRLSDPARKLAPQIDEILKSLWRAGLRTCQLTGSGSACFAVASSALQARRCAARVRASLEPGAIVMATRTTRVPSLVDIR